MADFPNFSHLPSKMNEDICFYEAVAQFVLPTLRLDGQVPSKTKVLLSKQLCDNLGVVGVSSKMFTTGEPLCFATQAIAHLRATKDEELVVLHVAGVRNGWADKISRADQYSTFMAALKHSNRRHVDIPFLLKQIWS